MRKFILWVSMSIFLGVVSVAIVSMGDSDAAPVKKKKKTTCPPNMIMDDSINFPDERDADRNGNGRVCINPAGHLVDDNVPLRKVKPKK